ncbi:MAG: SIMPL domain-containing protein [bacterium]
MNVIVRRGIFAFVLVLASSFSAFAELRLITVTGDAEVRVTPDEVILTLGVETCDKDIGVAKSQNDKRVKKLLAVAKKYKIESKHVQTDHISIEPRYSDDYEKRNFIGYFVRKTIVFTLKDIAKFEDLLSDVLEAGANYVHGVQFRTTKLRKYRDQARALAIKAAEQKANDLAKELGQKIGKPHMIQEDQVGWWCWYNAWWGSRWWRGGMAQNVIQNVGGAPSVAESSIALGQINVNAKVTVSFELE